MLSVFVMIGISGSGKSTYAKKLHDSMVERGVPVVTISSDSIREELCNGDTSDQSKNGEVFKLAHRRIRESLENGINPIFDATNLSTDERKPVLKIAKELGARTVAIVVDTRLNTAIERNRARTRVVPTPVIWRQYNRYCIPLSGEFDMVKYIRSE